MHERLLKQSYGLLTKNYTNSDVKLTCSKGIDFV